MSQKGADLIFVTQEGDQPVLSRNRTPGRPARRLVTALLTKCVKRVFRECAINIAEGLKAAYVDVVS